MGLVCTVQSEQVQWRKLRYGLHQRTVKKAAVKNSFASALCYLVATEKPTVTTHESP